MEVVFRAELMPGRDGSERTFRVQELLPSGRVLLENFSGEHAEKEFERRLAASLAALPLVNSSSFHHA